MFNVIRAELFKTVRKRRTYLAMGLLWLLFPAFLLFIGWLLKTKVAGTFVDNRSGFDIGAIIGAISSPIAIARNSLLMLGYLSPSVLIIIAALSAALFIGEERTQNMWKTVLIAAPNRLSVLTGKFVCAMLVLGALMLGCYLTGPVLGGLGTFFLPTHFAASAEWTGLLGLYALQWLFASAIMLFAFLLIWLFRSLPLGIVAVFFLPAFIEGVISFYRTVIGFSRLNPFNALLQALQLRSTFEALPKYYFTTNAYAPSRLPLEHLTDALGPQAAVGGPLTMLTNLSPPLSHAAWVTAVYAAVFAALLVWGFSRRDVP